MGLRSRFSSFAKHTDALTPVDPSGRIDPQSGVAVEKKSKAERLFVARLDAILLVYGCISQVIKYLDQQNINAAYVSGMKEDLDLYRNEYNYFQTFFNVGYAVFLIPSQVIITRVRPSWWLPALEFCWGILTLSLYKVTSAKQIAFCGAFEASAYPGTLMILMSWYTPQEIAFRIGFYHSCQTVGNMLANALQAAIYKSLNGHGGLEGWRWMFMVDGIMTMVLALFGFFILPDFPSKPNPWSFWLRDRHIEMAKERTERFRRSDNKKFTWATIKRTIRSPLIYFFATLYPAAVLAQQGYSYFQLFLKSLKNADGTPTWSVEQLNAIPIGGGAITVVTVWVYSFLSDYFQTRWLIVMAQAVFGLIPCIIMSIWNVPLGAKYFSFFATYLSLATAPPIFAWMSDLSPHDSEQRAFILGLSIAMYYAVGAWSNILIWPTVEAPHYRHAWQSCIALWCLVIIELILLHQVELRYIRPRNQRIAQEKWEAMMAAEVPNKLSREGETIQGEVEGSVDTKKDPAIGRIQSASTA
ncbi:major facilitator superfamily domain-containing protein [Kockovaella imperatae]|uniref:Major facilitator superfamily domain-containing protein n=1 Tax=Kockovaella imperatae TaxID=4999 RepID=A0A1Y1U9W9_9TREE|nr:major facilitator superfamily domain-containing protein [Kockovaella imperatae]ORX34841.1 major facilitator superfamily domain-containing protein [Kockovaella imperatae]